MEIDTDKPLEAVAWMYELSDGFLEDQLVLLSERLRGETLRGTTGWTETPLTDLNCANEIIKGLEERLKDVASSLVAAISILRQAHEHEVKPELVAASTRMFLQMLSDYQASVDRARAALKEEV